MSLLISSYLPVFSAAAPFAAFGALVLSILAAFIALAAHRRVRRLTFRKDASLEDTLGELSRRTRELQAFREELELYLKHAENRLQKSIQGVGVVRFNPFHGDGSGGNQSFAAAFLDEHGNGIVFSAIYAREGQTSVYAKPLVKGLSQFELTEEESEAIRKAKENAKVPPVEKK